MTRQADDPNLIRVAKRIVEWYQEPTEDEGVLKNIDAGSRLWRLPGFHQVFKGIMQAENFARDRELLLRKWLPVFSHGTGVDMNDAQNFLKEWIAGIDHRLLFIRSVTVGSTFARRDNPSSDYPVSYYGNRCAWTLHLTLRGAATYHAGNTVTAERGDLVLIAPDASCHYGRKPEIDQWLHHWAVFQPKPEWKDLMQWRLCAPGMLKLSIEEESDFLLFEKIFEQMFRLNEEEGPLAERIQGNLLEQLLLRATHYLVAAGHEPTDTRIFKAMEYMSEHLREMTSVADVANVCDLSESRLSHLFQQHLGMGVHKYRSDLRLQQAKKLLVTTDEPITRVALAVGYKDPVQFSKFFSRNIGYSPRDFRAAFTGS